MADVVATNDQGDVGYHAASGQVLDAASLRRLTFQIGDTAVPEVKVWAHQVEPEGTSTPLPARLTLSTADGESCASQDLAAGPALVPWSGGDGRIELAFPPASLSRPGGSRSSRSARS